MIATVFWLLLAVSNGAYNRGNVVIVARFVSAADCAEAKRNVKNEATESTEFTCVRIDKGIF